MQKTRKIIESGLFYIEHLDPDDEDVRNLIKGFVVSAPEGEGLSQYLKKTACNDERNRLMRTYIVRLSKTNECVGYFSLKAGLISLNEVEIKKEDNKTGNTKIKREFDTLPGVELANFAVNSRFIERYSFLKGIGYVIFRKFILPMIDEAAEYIGIKLVYIYSLPYERLVKRYEKYGFRCLSEDEEEDIHRRLKPRYDKSCRFMYLILKS